MHSSLLSITVALSYLLVFRKEKHWLQNPIEQVAHPSFGRVSLDVISLVNKLYFCFGR